MLLLAAGGGDVFGEGLQGALLLRAQLGAVRLLLGGEGEAVRELALLLRGLLVLALGGGVVVAGAGEGIGGGFPARFRGFVVRFRFLPVRLRGRGFVVVAPAGCRHSPQAGCCFG